MARKLDHLNLHQGTKAILRFTVEDRDQAPLNPNDDPSEWEFPPKDLTNLDLFWALSKRFGSSFAQAATLEKSLSDGITKTDAINGVCEVEVLTADLPTQQGPYYQELEVEDAISERNVVAYGNVTLWRKNTDPTPP